MPRLYHTKSRTGCKRCRARRVKCDESRPTCDNCNRHGVPCNYDRLDAQAASEPTPESSRAPSLAESRQRRQRELRLMLAFTTQTAHTIAGTHIPQLMQIWTIDVPNLALDFEPLHNSLMALTSHYMARKAASQDDIDHYLTLRSLYMHSTIHKHRIAVADLNRSNADAVSFTTAILTIDAFAHLQDRPLEPYEPPVQWLQLSRGMGRVCKLALDLIRDKRDAKIWPVMMTLMPYIHESYVFNYAPFAHLLQPNDGEVWDEVDVEAYREATRMIAWILQGRENGEHMKMYCRRITMFLVMVTDRFAELLEQQDPRALVILAHFFALSSYASDVWWIGDMPYREVRAISAVLSPQWQPMLEWPVQVCMYTGGQNRLIGLSPDPCSSSDFGSG